MILKKYRLMFPNAKFAGLFFGLHIQGVLENHLKIPATAGLPEQTGGPADPGERPGRVGGSEDPEHGKESPFIKEHS